MKTIIYFLKLLVFKVYTLFTHKKVIILRDMNVGYSFLYTSAYNADIVVKNQCDSDLCLLDKTAETVEPGLVSNTISKGIQLLSVDLHSLFKLKTLNEREKYMIMNALLNKDFQRMTLV